MNKNKNMYLKNIVIALGLTFVIACSTTVKRADVPNSANPQEEISKLDNDINIAMSKNIDVLAPSKFSDVLSWKDEAKKDLANANSQEEILNDIRKSRNFLDEAYATAKNRDEKAPSLFESRQAALKAGAGNYPELQSDLKSADRAISSRADSIGDLSAEKLSEMQQRYVILEQRAVVASQLGNSKALINGARKDSAARLAPQTLKKAEFSLKNAESSIATNVRHEEGYKTAVDEANADAALLMAVMEAIKQNKNLSESAALKMVAQNRQISELQDNLSTTTSEGAIAERSLQERNRQLAAANKKVGIQSAIETARKQFTATEAEAYQQGSNLVIRMKNVNFASGRSDLPESSLASLAKVSEIAKSLNASEIKVEGHTDSIGSAAQNKTISNKRASAVASYFKTNGFENIDVESEGYGFSKPIATNKSKAGRLQNRRVDIVITPEASSPSTVR